jgi:hypothetical protein
VRSRARPWHSRAVSAAGEAETRVRSPYALPPLKRRFSLERSLKMLLRVASGLIDDTNCRGFSDCSCDCRRFPIAHFELRTRQDERRTNCAGFIIRAFFPARDSWWLQAEARRMRRLTFLAAAFQATIDFAFASSQQKGQTSASRSPGFDCGEKLLVPCCR